MKYSYNNDNIDNNNNNNNNNNFLLYFRNTNLIHNSVRFIVRFLYLYFNLFDACNVFSFSVTYV